MKLRNFLGRLFASQLAVLLICAGIAFAQSSNGTISAEKHTTLLLTPSVSTAFPHSSQEGTESPSRPVDLLRRLSMIWMSAPPSRPTPAPFLRSRPPAPQLLSG